MLSLINSLLEKFKILFFKLFVELFCILHLLNIFTRVLCRSVFRKIINLNLFFIFFKKKKENKNLTSRTKMRGVLFTKIKNDTNKSQSVPLILFRERFLILN